MSSCARTNGTATTTKPAPPPATFQRRKREEREGRPRRCCSPASLPPRRHDGRRRRARVHVRRARARTLAGSADRRRRDDDDGEQERKKSEGRNRKETEKNFARSPIGRPGREHCQQRATATAENILRNLSPDEKRRRNSDKREISFNSTTRLTPPSLNATAETTENTSSPSSTTRGSKILQRSAEPEKDEATSLSGGGTG